MHESLNFRTIARVAASATSNSRQSRGREMKELGQNFEQKAFSNTMAS